jgi:hypothetical protein
LLHCHELPRVNAENVRFETVMVPLLQYQENGGLHKKEKITNKMKENQF